MREFILVHEADASGGELLKEKVRQYIIPTKEIELIGEKRIGIINPDELSTDIKEKFMIEPKQLNIKGSYIFFSETSLSKGLISYVIESPEEIYSKMYEDEKSKKEV